MEAQPTLMSKLHNRYEPPSPPGRKNHALSGLLVETEVQGPIGRWILHSDLLDPELNVTLGASIAPGEPLQYRYVRRAEEHVAVRVQAVATRSTNLLAVVLQRLGHMEVDDLHDLRSEGGSEYSRGVPVGCSLRPIQSSTDRK